LAGRRSTRNGYIANRGLVCRITVSESVTTSTGTRGRYLDTSCALRPLEVKTTMSDASTSIASFAAHETTASTVDIGLSVKSRMKS